MVTVCVCEFTVKVYINLLLNSMSLSGSCMRRGSIWASCTRRRGMWTGLLRLQAPGRVLALFRSTCKWVGPFFISTRSVQKMILQCVFFMSECVCVCAYVCGPLLSFTKELLRSLKFCSKLPLSVSCLWSSHRVLKPQDVGDQACVPHQKKLWYWPCCHLGE